MTPRQQMDIWAEGRRPLPAQLCIVQQVLKINRLRLQGYGCRTIGKALGLDKNTVNKWLKKLGWEAGGVGVAPRGGRKQSRRETEIVFKAPPAR